MEVTYVASQDEMGMSWGEQGACVWSEACREEKKQRMSRQTSGGGSGSQRKQCILGEVNGEFLIK